MTSAASSAAKPRPPLRHAQTDLTNLASRPGQSSRRASDFLERLKFSREEHDKLSSVRYGTFKEMPLHECIFELSTFLKRARSWSRFYLFIVILATLLWPIGWLIAAVTGFLGFKWRNKALQMTAVYFLMGTIVGLLMFLPQAPLWFIEGEGSIMQSLADLKISVLDVMGFWLDEMLLLMCITFCMTHHEVCENVGSFKQEAVNYLTDTSAQDNHAAHGSFSSILHINNDDYFMEQVAKLNRESGKDDTRSEDTAADVRKRGASVLDLISVLENTAGWPKGSDTVLMEDKPSLHERLFDCRGGFFEGLRDNIEEADEWHVAAMDIYMIEASYYEGGMRGGAKDTEAGWLGASTYEMLRRRLLVAFYQVMEVAPVVAHHLNLFRHPKRLPFIASCALFRGLIPRLWVGFYFGHPFFPEDLPLLGLAVWSFITTTIVSFLWLSIFLVMSYEYGDNVKQCMMIGMVVDPRVRLRYVNDVLAKSAKCHTCDERTDMLAKVPLISLRRPENCTGFWRLREYGVIDRSNERTAMEMLMDMLIIWLFLKFALTLMDIFKGGSHLSALVPTMLFDLLVFGPIVLDALSSALAINSMMREHKRIFVEARYDNMRAGLKLSKQGFLEDMGGPRSTTFDHDPLLHDSTALKRSSDLMAEYIEMINNVDVRETILLGLDVTPLGILGAMLTVGMASFTILNKLYHSNVANSVASNAQTMSRSTLSHGNGATDIVNTISTIIHHKIAGSGTGVSSMFLRGVAF